jgi:hypothetical protein
LYKIIFMKFDYVQCIVLTNIYETEWDPLVIETYEKAPIEYGKCLENLVANDLECGASFSFWNNEQRTKLLCYHDWGHHVAAKHRVFRVVISRPSLVSLPNPLAKPIYV